MELSIRSVMIVGFLGATALMAAEPIAVGDRPCLFLDDRFIAEQSGLSRTWHQGQPRPEVAIQATEPWEEWPHCYGSVFRDPTDGVFRMYYSSAVYPARTNTHGSYTGHILYAESKDGKSWTKPNLGRYEDLGSKNNSIVIYSGDLANVIVDSTETNAAERLKMFVYLRNTNPYSPGGLGGESLLVSGNGLDWKYVGPFDKPTYANPAHAEYTDSHFFMRDTLEQRYLAYVRTWVKAGVAERKDGRRRAVGISQSKSINKDWSPIENVLEADSQDDAAAARMSQDPNAPDWAELYCLHFFNYGNHYIGLLSIFYLIDGKDQGKGGDLQLVFSHDGYKWFRPSERTPAIARSNAKDLFPTYFQTNEPLELGDELWFYYSEANGAHPRWPAKDGISQIRAATWRKDGFVSMECAEKGTLTTPPLTVEGKELRVNFKGESLRVSLLDGTGQKVAESEPVTGDAVSAKVIWRKRSDISSFQGKSIRLRFELEKGQLWSFRFAQ